MTIFKKHIAAMSAYSPPLEGRDASQHLLLDFNERTLPVSQSIREALIDFINGDRLQMYPSYGDVCDVLANYCGVSASQVMITNGSDQGIELIFRSICSEGDEVIIPGPSFAMYKQCAGVENLNVIEPQYTREEGYPLQAVLGAITKKTRLVVVSNPNNPCGTLVAPEDILTIASAAPQAAILVDECYFEYTQTTVCEYLERYPNLLITRTFSKTWGMPSLRFGYLLSAVDNIRCLMNVRGPYDVNQLAVVAARAALANPLYTENYVREVMEEAKPLLERFLEERDIPYWRSAANYLWIFPENTTPLTDALMKANILVRPKGDSEGNMGLRITIGTLEQTAKLISVLREAV